MNRRVSPLLAPLLVAACVEEGEPRLLMPEGIEVVWEDAYNLEGDGLGALVPVDVMAYDGATGEPLADVELLVWTEDDDAWPVPAEGVLLVGSGPDVSAFWDASRDQFVMLELADDPLTLVTDASGLARSYLYVDAFPDGADGEPYAAIPVFVSMDGGRSSSELILLQPW